MCVQRSIRGNEFGVWRIRSNRVTERKRSGRVSQTRWAHEGRLATSRGKNGISGRRSSTHSRQEAWEDAPGLREALFTCVCEKFGEWWEMQRWLESCYKWLHKRCEGIDYIWRCHGSTGDVLNCPLGFLKLYPSPQLVPRLYKEGRGIIFVSLYLTHFSILD